MVHFIMFQFADIKKSTAGCRLFRDLRCYKRDDTFLSLNQLAEKIKSEAQGTSIFQKASMMIKQETPELSQKDTSLRRKSNIIDVSKKYSPGDATSDSDSNVDDKYPTGRGFDDSPDEPKTDEPENKTAETPFKCADDALGFYCPADLEEKGNEDEQEMEKMVVINIEDNYKKMEEENVDLEERDAILEASDVSRKNGTLKRKYDDLFGNSPPASGDKKTSKRKRLEIGESKAERRSRYREKKEVSDTVVKYLMPFYKTSKIGSREVFKLLARKIVHKLLLDPPSSNKSKYI